MFNQGGKKKAVTNKVYQENVSMFGGEPGIMSYNEDRIRAERPSKKRQLGADPAPPKTWFQLKGEQLKSKKMWVRNIFVCTVFV